MTCYVTLEFKVKNESAEELPIFLRKILPDTRGYDGCVSINVVQNQDEPTEFAVLEQWNTRQHYEDYLNWRTETGVLDELLIMVEGEPSIRFFDYLGV